MLFPTLLYYKTSVKTSTGFTPFYLVHIVKVVLPIDCQIPTLQSNVELIPNTPTLEQWFFNLEHLNKERRDSLQQNEAMKL